MKEIKIGGAGQTGPSVNELGGHVTGMMGSVSSRAWLPITLRRVQLYYWLYRLSFMMSDYESDIFGFGKIPGILLHHFEPIRLDLPVLYDNPVLDLMSLLFRHWRLGMVVCDSLLNYLPNTLKYLYLIILAWLLIKYINEILIISKLVRYKLYIGCRHFRYEDHVIEWNTAKLLHKFCNPVTWITSLGNVVFLTQVTIPYDLHTLAPIVPDIIVWQN